MSAFLNSLKVDLLERRLRAVLILLTAALVGTLVYALSGGSASAPAPPPTARSASPGASGIASVAAPTSTSQAVAETTSGSAKQRGSATRDPFVPLPGSTSPTATSSSSSAGKSTVSAAVSGSSASSGAPTSSSTPAATTPAPAAKNPSAAKPRTVYHVKVLFAAIPAGTGAPLTPLTPYAGVKQHRRLPTSRAPRLAFTSVTAGGNLATFTLIGHARPRGTATCLPSVTRCQQVVLSRGQRVEIEYLSTSGGPVVYELQLVSITSGKASAAAARR